MKVGDLVKWTHPTAESFGIVVKGPKYSEYWSSAAVYVKWLDGKYHGEYPVGHEWLVWVSEGR